MYVWQKAFAVFKYDGDGNKASETARFICKASGPFSIILEKLTNVSIPYDPTFALGVHLYQLLLPMSLAPNQTGPTIN